MPVRNEDWVLGLSARAVLMWCDELVILDHASTDGTRDIIRELAKEHPARVFMLEQSDEIWHEMAYRQALLDAGRLRGGTHFALVDADEVLTGDLLWPSVGEFLGGPSPAIRFLAARTQPGSILMLPWLCMSATCPHGVMDWNLCASCCRFDGPAFVLSSGMWANQNASTAFPDLPEYYWATRATYDFHHRHPMGRELDWNQPISDRGSGLMHLQFASWRRLRSKQYLYQLIEMKRWPHRRPADAVRHMYARTVEEAAGATVGPAPESWWAPYSYLMNRLYIDKEPWQEAECKRLLTENPGLGAGLDDFGLLREWGMEGVGRV